jgi:Tol biopolymer transport system component
MMDRAPTTPIRRGALIGAVVLGLCAACGAPALAAAGDIERVSVAASGAEAAGGASINPSISADGDVVAFAAFATNLVAGDTNLRSDIFVFDRDSGAIRRVNVDAAGAEANGGSFVPSLSGDGTFVAFDSSASNLVAGDSNAATDIFIASRFGGAPVWASAHANGASSDPSISADGRAVAFASDATNYVVGGDGNAAKDVFQFHRSSSAIERISADSLGGASNGGSFVPSLSADGRYAAFASDASNLVPGDTNGSTDVFLRDGQGNAVKRVSVDAAGAEADGSSFNPAVSADGRYVAFDSGASNLVAGDTNGESDVFVADRGSGAITRVSVDARGGEANGDSLNASISADGRYVAFDSGASNLVPGDTNDRTDVFVFDRDSGAIRRVSVDAAGAEANEASTFPSISADGRYVAFQSGASNLVAGDTNATTDVFVADLGAGVWTEGPPGDPVCSDGIDNDGDGSIDAADPDCQLPGPPVDEPGSPGPADPGDPAGPGGLANSGDPAGPGGPADTGDPAAPGGSGAPGRPSGPAGAEAPRRPRCAGRTATIAARPGRLTRGTRGPDVIVGTSGRDRIHAGRGADVICARGGADLVRGGGGRDLLLGGGGADRLKGGHDRDRLDGGRGPDRLDGGHGRDRCRGGRGHDRRARCER